MTNRRHASIFRERKSQGLCTGCGKEPHRPERLTCQACADLVSELQRRKREDRQAAKLCAGPCNRFWEGPYDMCDDCRIVQKLSRAEKDWRCRSCPNERNWPHQWCLDCAERTKADRAAKVANWRAAGLCVACGGAKTHPDATNCEKDSLQATARRCFNTTKRWEELRELFITQNGVCPYTGNKLIIGVDASLDHKIPKARGGSREIDNLEWVDYRVNTAKSDMLPPEFEEFILFLADRIKLIRTGRTDLANPIATG